MKRNNTVTALLACLAMADIVHSPMARSADENSTVDSCASCHGKDGVSTEKDVPTIAGYSRGYLADTLSAYQKQERPCPETKVRSGNKAGTVSDMCQSVKELSASDIKQVAQYFSAKKFIRATQSVDSALATKGREIHDSLCEKCHLDAGNNPNDDAGMLGGQWMPFLKAQFVDFKTGKRPMPQKMKPKIDKLSPDDFDALVNFYGSIK